MLLSGFKWSLGFQQCAIRDCGWLHKPDLRVCSLDQSDPEQHGDGDPGIGDHSTAQTAHGKWWAKLTKWYTSYSLYCGNIFFSSYLSVSYCDNFFIWVKCHWWEVSWEYLQIININKMNFTIWKTLDTHCNILVSTLLRTLLWTLCFIQNLCFLKISMYQLTFVYNYHLCAFSGRPGDHVQQHVQHDQQSTDCWGLSQVHFRCRPGPRSRHTFWGRAEVCPDHWFWWVRHMVKRRTIYI